MAEKNRKSKSGSLHPAKTISPAEKIRDAKKTLLDMKEKQLAEGLGISLPESLEASLDIGDEGDRAGNERIRDVSILLSARNKEKLLSIEGASERIREGTYGMCEECGDEIGSRRLKAMPLAKLCVTCQPRTEKEITHQRFSEERLSNRPLISEIAEKETD